MALAYSVAGWDRLGQHGTPVDAAKPLSRAARSLRIALLLASAMLSIAAFAQAKPAHKEHKRDEKREIEAAELQWRTAQLAGDVATMDKLLAEDYFGISNNGQLNNKTQQLERLQKRTL